MTAKLSGTRGRRARAALWLPAVTAFLYLAVFAPPDPALLLRLLYAAILGFMLQVAAMVVYFVAFHAVGYAFGSTPNWAEPFVDDRALTAAVLMAVLVWIWWQSNRQSVVNGLARCVDDNRYELQTQSPSALVLSCYDTREAGASYDIDWDD